MMDQIDGAKSCSVEARIRSLEEHIEDEQPYKRQKSERTETAELLETVLHVGAANGDDSSQETQDEGTNGVDRVGDFLEDILHAVTPDRLQPQIGPKPVKPDEVFDNNIQVKHPDRETDGIPLGVHLKKHRRGYRIHRILRKELRESNALREGDIIQFVGETDVTSLPIETVKKVFWNLDFDVTLKLVILRTPEDEPDSAAERSDYRVATVSLHLQKGDDEITFTARIDVNSGSFHTYDASTTNYYVLVKEASGDQRYLCVDDGVPKMLQLLDTSDDVNFYWRKQLTLGPDGVSRLILLHLNSQKTICCDLDPTQDFTFVKLSNEGFLPKGMRHEADIRWVVREHAEGEEDPKVYYVRCAEHQSFYMSVSEEDATMHRLRYARDTDQYPKRKLYFKNVDDDN